MPSESFAEIIVPGRMYPVDSLGVSENARLTSLPALTSKGNSSALPPAPTTAVAVALPPVTSFFEMLMVLGIVTVVT